MASNSVSNSTKQGSPTPKRLAELLDQQQEPFILEVYLNERGCNQKTRSGFEGVSLGCLFRGKRLSKGSTKNVGFPGTTHVKNAGLQKEATTLMGESGRLSSSASEFNSCSGSDVEDVSINGTQIRKQSNHQTDEDAADEMVQCSPISVLDEIQVIPNVTPSRLSFSFPKEYIFSGSFWEMLVRKRRDGVVMNSKKALQQTRQLVFDCVREAVESDREPRKSRHLKIISDKIRCWEKQSADGKKKIIKLLRSDLLTSYHEKHHSDGFTEQVVKEVGDRILEEMTHEIVHLYLCKSHQICYHS